MADRFVIAAGGNWSAAGTWSATDGGAGGAGVPGAGDNACCSNLSGNLVADATSGQVCLDLDFTRGTGYTGTFSSTDTARPITISGSVKFSGGMTLTYSSRVTMNATSGTKTITSNGKTFPGGLTFNGAGGTFQLADNLTMSNNSQQSSLIQLLAGSFDPNGKKVTFNGNGGAGGVSGNAITFFDWEVSNASAFTTCQLAVNVTVTGTLKLLGASDAGAIRMASSVRGTPRTLTVNAVDAASNRVEFMDIAFAGAAAPYATGARIGNCQGNSGITFTAAVTLTWANDVSGNWAIAANWSGSRAGPPLAQDTAVVNKAFSAGRTITIDSGGTMGKDIDLSACTGNPNFAVNNAMDFFGTFKQSAAMTNSGTGSFIASGRGSQTIRSNGVTWARPLTINGPGGTYTLEDALASSASLTLAAGGFNDAGFNVSATTWTNTGAATRSVVRSGLWSLSASGSVISVATTGLTSTDTGTIKLTDASASTKTIAGGGGTFNDLWLSGAGTGVYQFTGSNVFGTLRADASRNIQFTAGTTTTSNSFSWDGCTIGSITAASHTLAKAGGGKVNCSGMTISRSTATPGTTFFALGSTNGGNNSGWTFGAGMDCSAGSFAIAGQAAGLSAQRRGTLAAGALAIAASDANLDLVRLVAGVRSSEPPAPRARPEDAARQRPSQTSRRRPAQ